MAAEQNKQYTDEEYSYSNSDDYYERYAIHKQTDVYVEDIDGKTQKVSSLGERKQRKEEALQWHKV